MDKSEYRGHVLVVPYPTQGHINPLLQLSKRIASKGFKATLAITTFVSTTNPTFTTPPSTASQFSVHFDTFSDGYDVGGFATAESIDAYLSRFKDAGSASLAQLIEKLADSKQPIDCIVYDSFLPWALDVAKQYGLRAAVFFTQACAVNCIYYYLHHGLLKLPVVSPPVKIPGLPPLEIVDMPGFVCVPGSYPAYFQMVLDQYSNVDGVDFTLVNTYHELEKEVVDSMGEFSRMLTIGPTVPSLHLDNRIAGDTAYGLSLHAPSSNTTNWLSNKPPGLVVYVSFGSLVNLEDHQMKELAWGLEASNCYFLWAIRDSEEEAKLPDNFTEQTNEKGLFVKWCSQLEVLANEAIGCFITHCGWNSTIEALCLGVPMVGMPIWTDQPTNAKLIQDVWKVGLRPKADDKGLVTREEVETCIRRVMDGEEGQEMKANAKRWSKLAKEAISEGGSSDKNIDEFLSKVASL